MQSTISELDKTRTDKEEFSKKFYQLENTKNKFSVSLEAMRNENEQSMQNIKDFETKINAYQSEYRIKESRLKFLIETEKEKEGYARSVKSLLEATEKDKALSRGVHGVLANLISVDKQYETAIEMTLGASIQNIVTDSEDEAKKLVNYLRDNNLGRASFLPITSVKGQKVTGVNDRGVSGVIGVASDLVKSDKRYEGIVLNLLGRTVIVEDIDSAVKLAKQNSYKFKIVTLKGDVINPSGAISGGSVSTKTVNILGRGKEIEELSKELKEIEQKIEKITKEKENFEKSISKIIEKYEKEQKEAQSLEITYATEKQKFDNLENEISKIETKLAKEKIDLENIKKEQQENDKIQEELNSKVVVMDKENKELNDIVEEFTKANKDNQKYIDDLNFDITNLKISVSSFDESEVSINEIMDRINQEIENNSTNIENKKASRQKIIKDNEELESKIVEIRQKIIDLEKEVLGSSEKIEKLKQDRILKSEKLAKIEKEIEEENTKVEDIKNHISKLDLKNQR